MPGDNGAPTETTRLGGRLSYWKEQLSGAPFVLDLYTDRPRRARSETMEGSHVFRLSRELRGHLVALADAGQSSTFVVLAAALGALMHRYTGQGELLLGALTGSRASRDTSEGARSCVVLRINLTQDPTSAVLCEQVRHRLQATFDQGFPILRELVDSLGIEPEQGRHPLFQVLLVDESGLAASDEPMLSGMSSSTEALDLCFSFEDRDGEITGRVVFALELFERSTIVRLTTYLIRFLEAMAAQPETRVSDLPFLTDADRQQLRDWSAPRIPYPERCLHELIEDQAERTPDAIALEFEHRRLSYRELNERANQLGHYLRARGVGPDALVGLCVNRSPEFIISVLGILKSGGAYLPLDPDYPDARLEFILQDSQVSALVADRSSSLRLPPHPARTILVDDDWGDISKEPTSNPVSGVSLDNLIYVMYTSGSTGKPKGVLVTHRGVTSLGLVGTSSLCSEWGDKVLQFHSPSFDPSVFEILLSLPWGKTLVLGTKDDLLPGSPLIRLLSRHAVETLALPASSLAVLPLEELPALKLIFVEGETPSPDAVARWAVGRRIFNTYGPTEASMWCVGTYLDGSERPPPIGRPIANVDVAILDDRLQLVPPGVTGELYVGGVGLARGYLRRPELTAERFISSPFDGEPGARLYKTGDLARYRSDGIIEFLGRRDEQVKVRGYRIELAEIETVLTEHPNVREAVVLAREDRPGIKRLVAYVILEHSLLDIGSLRAFVRQQLPDHMVPAVFVMLDSFPVTPNGKLDRRALQALDETRPQLRQNLVHAPTRETEEMLADVWRNVLDLEYVGIRDSFTELGGDSLLAIMVVSEIERVFGRTIPVDDLIGAEQTIEQLALHLDAVRAN